MWVGKWTRRGKASSMLLGEDSTAKPLSFALTTMLLLPLLCSHARASRDGQEETAGESRTLDSSSTSAFQREYDYQAAFDRGYQYGRSSMDIYEKNAALGSTASYNTGYLSRYGRMHRQEPSYGMVVPEQWKANKGVDDALQTLQSQLGHGSGDGQLLHAVDKAEQTAAVVTEKINAWSAGWDPGATPRILDETVKDITSAMEKGHQEIVTEVTDQGEKALNKLKSVAPEGYGTQVDNLIPNPQTNLGARNPQAIQSVVQPQFGTAPVLEGSAGDSLLQSAATAATTKIGAREPRVVAIAGSSLAESRASAVNTKDDARLADTSDTQLAGVSKHIDARVSTEYVEKASRDTLFDNTTELADEG
mmetsp:Transcript_14575/g.25804  ORF Transcript_14575/g.25804 Transcript_14575/m.25804 type:complete len:363 (-) Transcript_14575:23-1111(-)